MLARQSVEVPQPTFLALREHLRLHGNESDMGAALAAAVELWLAQQQEAAGAYGYQWKTVFLPEGTVLRSWSYGEHHYAHVRGDRIIYQGCAVSPNQLVQSFGSSIRNAWNDLFIRRPGDKTFKQACALRREIEREEQMQQQARLAATCPATPHAPATAPTPVTPVAALPAAPAADLSPQALAAIVTSVLAQMTPPRDNTPNPGWNLPERRQFRYRLEDIAFE